MRDFHDPHHYPRPRHWGGRPGSVAGHLLLGLLCGSAIAVAVGTVVMLLWNYLMPALFGVAHIHFWQALGLLLLCRLLVGGFHRGGHGFRGCRDKRWRSYEQWWREEGEKSFREFAANPVEPEGEKP